MRFRTRIAALLSHASPKDPTNTGISAEQIDHYREQGFVVIDDFLDADELADRDDQSGDSYYDKVFTQRLNLWMDHDGMRRLMLDTRLGKIMKAASSSFHNGLLAHGAAANMTPSHTHDLLLHARRRDHQRQTDVLPPDYTANPVGEGRARKRRAQSPRLPQEQARQSLIAARRAGHLLSSG